MVRLRKYPPLSYWLPGVVLVSSKICHLKKTEYVSHPKLIGVSAFVPRTYEKCVKPVLFLFLKSRVNTHTHRHRLHVLRLTPNYFRRYSVGQSHHLCRKIGQFNCIPGNCYPSAKVNDDKFSTVILYKIYFANKLKILIKFNMGTKITSEKFSLLQTMSHCSKSANSWLLKLNLN